MSYLFIYIYIFCAFLSILRDFIRISIKISEPYDQSRRFLPYIPTSETLIKQTNSKKKRKSSQNIYILFFVLEKKSKCVFSCLLCTVIVFCDVVLFSLIEICTLKKRKPRHICLRAEL